MNITDQYELSNRIFIKIIGESPQNSIVEIDGNSIVFNNYSGIYLNGITIKFLTLKSVS